MSTTLIVVCVVAALLITYFAYVWWTWRDEPLPDDAYKYEAAIEAGR